MEIYPSLISSDLLNLEKTIRSFEPWCDGYHIDVMDDHFVPNLTWGPAFVEAIAGATSLPLLLHLMVEDPFLWPNRVSLSPKDYFVFHFESVDDPGEISSLINEIKKSGIGVGMAINPPTTTATIEAFLSDLDMILVMTVEPGFSGQEFMVEVADKIPALVSYRQKNNLSFRVSVDGGINVNNIKLLTEKGADQIGVASALFSSKDPLAALKALYDAAQARPN